MLTRKGIALDLLESPYKLLHKGLIFYFSSEFYKNKFASGVREYVKTENAKFELKYKCKCDIELLLLINYYKMIEKRGFRIESKSGTEILENESFKLKILK